MKRYALFAYETYYPSGGWGDFVDSFDTIEEAATKAQTIWMDNMDIIDLLTGEDVTPFSVITGGSPE